MNIFDIAKQNQEKAWQVIKNTNIIQIWEDAGAKINLVGSLRTGLLMKHRDIDFHIYSPGIRYQTVCRRRTWCNRNERRKARTFLK